MTDDPQGMRPSNDNAELPPQPGNGWGFFAILIVVAGFGYFMATLLRTPPQDDAYQSGEGLIGQKAPEIKAEGWFNGPAPTEAELQGKIIVLDAWAYWCGPCRRKAPEVIRLYEEYGPKGVVFLGLTGEDQSALRESKEFIAGTKIPWPQGYGATSTLSRLHAEYIPQLWVVDQQGVIVWDQSAKEEINVALDRLLK